MAYGIKYYAQFNNELNESYEIFFSYDGWAGGITTVQLTGNPLQLNYLNNSESVLDPIITLEAIIQIWVPHTGTLTFENFITDRDDEIYVYVRKDGGPYIFHGWVIAEQGSQQFKDAPYVIELHCTDGLGLLKNAPLTSSAGTDLVGRQSLISFIAGILSKANHELNIRVWCDIYEDSMDDRGDSPDNDMFFQTYIDVRTFLDTEVKYQDCYEVLTKICAQHFIVFYYLGTWNVLRVADLQKSTPLNYVDYDLYSQIIGSGSGDTETAKIGINQRIRTHGEDFAVKSIEFAQKEARVVFNYRIPENLVNNQKLTRLGSFIAPLSGVGYAAYQLVGWTQKHQFLHIQTPRSVQTTYIKIDYDAFGYEVQRYYVIPVDLTATNAGNLKNYIINDNDDFFVDQYDKVSISFQYRYSIDLADGDSTLSVGQLAIHREGTSPGTFSNWVSADQNGSWVSGSGGAFFGVNLVGEDTTEWRTISFTDSVLPASGRMYLTFGADDNLPASTELYIKDLSITYTPQIRGGYTPVRGDFNRYEQNPNYKNSIDEEVYISDSPKRIIAGALMDDTGEALLDPTWYRYGVTEELRYSQLVALGIYNLHYRKFRRVEGTFKGYYYEVDTTGNLAPIGPMTKCEFVDTGEARQYIPMNLKMNIKKGWFDATFREIYDPGSNDGNEVGDENEFNYLF